MAAPVRNVGRNARAG